MENQYLMSWMPEHDPLDAGAVVPAAVKQDHLARGRQVRRVALEVPLRALAVVGCGQRSHATHARVQALGDAFDHAALARRIAALEDDHHLVPGGHDPVLQLHQLGLQAEQFPKVLLTFGLVLLQGLGVLRLVDPVLHLHFQLFVVTVHHIGVNAAQQLVLTVEHGETPEGKAFRLCPDGDSPVTTRCRIIAH